MAGATIGFGVALMLLGVGAYFGSGRESVTALIPAFFGAALAVCGWLALRPAWRRGAIIAALVVGVLGFLGSLSRVLPGLMRGEDVELTFALGVQLAMAAITAVFAGLCVRWLFLGRRADRAVG